MTPLPITTTEPSGYIDITTTWESARFPETSTPSYGSYDTTEDFYGTEDDELDTTLLPLDVATGTESQRIPRIIEQSGWEDTDPILSGQYHEVNPGQYHEVNPGQYHEVAPGRYLEVNPGQYHEVHPGQYQGQEEEEENDLKVEFEVENLDGDDGRVYNVQSKVDEFIIGEYGTIRGGQTLRGVRYTAVDDSSVDPNLIYDTLVKFFQFQ